MCQMVDELTKVQEEKEAVERVEEAERVASREKQSRSLQHPKRGLALLTKLRTAEAELQEAHTRTLRDAVRAVEAMHVHYVTHCFYGLHYGRWHAMHLPCTYQVRMVEKMQEFEPDFIVKLHSQRLHL